MAKGVTIDFVLDHDLPLRDQKIISEVMLKPARGILAEQFDWTHHIPEGSRVISIIVNKGEIIEKTYLSNQNELIVVGHN